MSDDFEGFLDEGLIIDNRREFSGKKVTLKKS